MSLLETLIALSIFAIMSIATFSTYEAYYYEKELKAAAQNFIGNLNYARELSIVTGKTLYLCASLDKIVFNPAWQGNLIVFESDSPPEIQSIFKISSALPTKIHFDLHFAGFTDNNYLFFKGNGEMMNNGSFTFDYGRDSLQFKVSKMGIVRNVL